MSVVDQLVCICPPFPEAVSPGCPVHSSEPGTAPLPRYSLLRVNRSLDQVRDQLAAQPENLFLVPLVLAIYHLVQYIRAKERGDIP
jgi:hypothetical protein